MGNHFHLVLETPQPRVLRKPQFYLDRLLRPLNLLRTWLIHMAPSNQTCLCFALFLSLCTRLLSAAEDGKITHSFLGTGAETRIVSGEGQVTWRSPLPSRDGWVLAAGHILLAVSKCDEFPKGGAIELTQTGETLFRWQGTQEEVNTVQALPNHTYLVAEAGPSPRLLEIDRTGKILVQVPIQCQLTNLHMQTRMSRKLPNGNYLVPQLLDKVVREYTPEGKIVWEAQTPHWAFTAIRLANGNTLVGCTYGNEVVELDRQGAIVWEVSNDDLPTKPIKDACGVQRLPNGNTVITSYGAKAGEVRLTEAFNGVSAVRWLRVLGGEPAAMAPIFKKQPLVALYNGATTLRMTPLVQAFPAPTYQWQRDGKDVAGAVYSALTLTNLNPRLAGRYQLVVSNALGAIVSEPVRQNGGSRYFRMSLEACWRATRFPVTNATSGMTAWNFSPTLSGLLILNERKPRVALARKPGADNLQGTVWEQLSAKCVTTLQSYPLVAQPAKF